MNMNGYVAKPKPFRTVNQFCQYLVDNGVPQNLIQGMSVGDLGFYMFIVRSENENYR